ncbi:GntR family transcriptional regulator [Candidatus Poribacteria bacterium]|nr:GntR family transcriptional regulator [Candidatus Poribacteria bacterium]
MEFQVNKNSHVPVYVQLEEQLRFAIATGILKDGERLPSIRELAQRLDINVNTISKVYQRLQEQSLIVTRGPKGAFVSPQFHRVVSRAGELDVSKPGNSHEDLVEIVDAAIAEALKLGHKLVDLQRIFNERIEAVQSTSDLPVVAFVECSEIQARDHVQELKTHFQACPDEVGANFQPVVLSDLENQPELVQSADLVVTTLFHLGQVKDLVGKTIEVVGVVVNLQVEVLQQLSSFPAGTKLGVVCRDEETVTAMESTLRDICPKGVEISVCTLGDKAALEKLFSQVDTLVYTPPCRNEIETLAPANLPRIEHRLQIDANSLRFLKEKIGMLSLD